MLVRLESDHVLIVSREGILSGERLPSEPDVFDPADTLRVIADS